MTNPNYYDSRLWLTIMTHHYHSHDYDSHDYDSKGVVSPNCGHHDCTILYPLHNLNCKHWTRILPIYNKCYASILIVPCYVMKNLNSTTKML